MDPLQQVNDGRTEVLSEVQPHGVSLFLGGMSPKGCLSGADTRRALRMFRLLSRPFNPFSVPSLKYSDVQRFIFFHRTTNICYVKKK